ncbi:hypothetical protein ACWGNZ_00580 [Sphingomonas zeae]
MRTCLWAGALALACSLAAPVTAQTQLPPVKDWAGRTVPGGAAILVDKDGRAIGSDNPLPTTGGGSAKGQQTTANSQSVAPASDSPAFPTRTTDGANAALGSTTDAAYSGSGASSLIGINKALLQALSNPTPAGTNSIGTVVAVGNVASGAADSGSPLKIGGVYRATLPLLSDGQRADLQLGQRGQLFATLMDPSGNYTFKGRQDPGDGIPNNGANALDVYSYGTYYNGSTWDRTRGDASGAFIGASQFWTESTVGLGANLTLNGALRANGGLAGGVGSRAAFFIAKAFSDVAGGTLYVDVSIDGGTTWRVEDSIALVAGKTVQLKVQITAAAYRARVVNGGTAQGAALVTTANSLT